MAFLWAVLFATAALFQTQSRASPAYQLEDNLNYTNFFDAFDFFTGDDPTNGYVNYVDRATASTLGYISADPVRNIRMSVDANTVISPPGSARGRDSIRISTQKDYTRGLIVGDIQHMPFGCGTWPAFWMLGPNWPTNGEIDIIEGVNMNSMNLNSLHTSDGCGVSTQSQLATPETQNCYIYAAGQTSNAGCGSLSTSIQTYGDGFNANGGGVWAVQWTSDFIKIWFFPHGTEPADLLADNPDPDANAPAWGVPQSWFQGSCVINDHFAIQNIIFDNTFCGDWAGNDYVWGDLPADDQTGCAVSTGYSTCEAYVAARPGDFANAYWEVNSLRYFREVVASPSTTSTTSSMTFSSTSSSTTSSSAVDNPTTTSLTSSTTSLITSSAAESLTTILTTSSTASLSTTTSSLGGMMTSSSSILSSLQTSSTSSVSSSPSSSTQISVLSLTTTSISSTIPLIQTSPTTLVSSPSPSLSSVTKNSPSLSSLSTASSTTSSTSSSDTGAGATDASRPGDPGSSLSVNSSAPSNAALETGSDPGNLPATASGVTISTHPSNTSAGSTGTSRPEDPSSSSDSGSSAPSNATPATGGDLGFPFTSGQVIIHLVTTTTYCPWTCIPTGYSFPTVFPTENTLGFRTYTETLGDIRPAPSSPKPSSVPGVITEPPTGMGGSAQPWVR